MAIRHAAALALVGWLLLMPPWRPALDVNAPQRKWVPFREWYPGAGPSLVDSFRDLADCQASLAELKEFVKKDPHGLAEAHDPRLYPSDEDFAVMVGASLCIEDDDPRLRGNTRYRGK